MKSPADYLNAPVFYLTYPTGEEAESAPVVTYDDALRAVEAALADAEQYRYLLMRALRRNNQEAPTEAASTPVVSMRPVYSEDDIAA
ncbi:hypothetical protein [Hymenobacter sp. DG25A]|jgi:hypothetical protein|uniref:hypothetical protein n=1 Tax=Hymenobacter sp. DG25A TaxID=1385663 RepID=UPI0006BD5FD1|nr:hypothetical protein [Hymenobacter sp. DG25A]ALD20399.1 hypothetical protein AM218_03105 [Hymenobacter sp. DG25A]